MRSILMIAVVLASLYASQAFTPHHVGRNPFETLYFHLIPSPLVVPAEDGEHAGEHAADEHAADEHADGAHGEAGAHAPVEPLLEVPLPRFLAFLDWRGERGSEHPRTVLFNLQIFQVAAVLLCLIGFSGVPGHVRTRRGDRVSRILTGSAMWIRDEMVYPIMGRDLGRRFLPYFLCVFFFILFMNLMGLLPFAATPTASIFVTAALALTTFLAMIGCGMVAQGPIAFWKNLVPHVPLALWPLMFVVEVLGLLVKPFALMVRLFANLSGGHMVVLSFMGLIFFFADKWGAVGGWGSIPIGVGFAVFIMIIETFVALLQAYVFTQLSIIFVNLSVHPEH